MCFLAQQHLPSGVRRHGIRRRPIRRHAIRRRQIRHCAIHRRAMLGSVSHCSRQSDGKHYGMGHQGLLTYGNRQRRMSLGENRSCC